MDLLLKVEQLSKKFSRDLSTSLRFASSNLFRRNLRISTHDVGLRNSEFWALREVSFRLERGEILAILGHNGAGKSTLLKCISEKLRPDTGNVIRNGHIGYLLEMNAGFTPTMTGRDNTLIRGRLLGKKGKELECYVLQVQEFADIGEFFDMPLQFYSSGMKARLGFAASSFMMPDILIIDEVLAVGDLGFRIKCYERINEISKKAGVLFVSHSLGQVARMCNRGLFLEKGRVIYDGNIQGAIRLYQEKLGQGNDKADRYALNKDLIDIEFYVAGIKIDAGQTINYGDPMALKIDISRLPSEVQLRILLRDAGSGLIMDWNSARSQLEWPAKAKWVWAELGSAELNPGAYAVAVQVMSSDGREHLCLSLAIPFRVRGELLFANSVQKRANWSFLT